MRREIDIKKSIEIQRKINYLEDALEDLKASFRDCHYSATRLIEALNNCNGYIDTDDIHSEIDPQLFEFTSETNYVKQALNVVYGYVKDLLKENEDEA